MSSSTPRSSAWASTAWMVLMSCRADLEPLRPALAAALELHLMRDHRAHGCASLLVQVLLEEREDLLPAVDGLLLPIRPTVVVEEAVTGTVVAMELVVLAVLL